jgi:hypothetical protein
MALLDSASGPAGRGAPRWCVAGRPGSLNLNRLFAASYARSGECHPPCALNSVRLGRSYQGNKATAGSVDTDGDEKWLIPIAIFSDGFFGSS